MTKLQKKKQEVLGLSKCCNSKVKIKFNSYKVCSKCGMHCKIKELNLPQPDKSSEDEEKELINNLMTMKVFRNWLSQHDKQLLAKAWEGGREEGREPYEKIKMIEEFINQLKEQREAATSIGIDVDATIKALSPQSYQVKERKKP